MDNHNTQKGSIHSKSVDILGVKFNTETTINILEKVKELIRTSNHQYIVTPNPEFLLEASNNTEFKTILNQAAIAIPDGIGILWAAKYLSLKTSQNSIIKYIQSVWQLVYTELSLLFYPQYCRSVIPERITGSDFILKIVELAAQNNLKIYLLGARPGIAKQAAEVLKIKYPQINIVGAQDGSPLEKDDDKICGMINQATPDIIFVAYGAPKQEYWIKRNLNQLNTVKFAMGVGGSFDFIAGKIKRAPKIMQAFGLEWLYRLIQEPTRIKRIYHATIKFPLIILQYKLKSNL